MDTINIPDAIALGLSYDEESHAKMNLLAAVYDAGGQNLGYIQAGGSLTNLFNGAIVHTGDTQGETIGDQENIVIDFRAIPPQATTIMFGTYLVTPSNTAASAYVHMLPMLRGEQISAQEASGGTRSIDFDSDEEDEQFLNECTTGTRGIGDEQEDDEFVRLYHEELDHNTAFQQQRGIVGGKLFRNHLGTWSFTPYRTVVNADPQFGLWPALEHYAKPQQPQQQQFYAPQQQVYGAPPAYY